MEENDFIKLIQVKKQGDLSEEEADVEQELANYSFEELQRARSSGLLYNVHVKADEHKSKRANKNRPTEISSKKPVGRFRQVVVAPKREVCDPRFESLCGSLDIDGFRKRYNFMFEVELPAEKEKLQKMLEKTKDPKRIQELKDHIKWIEKQLKTGSTGSIGSKILAEHKKKEREAVKKGKKPYYLKKSEIRKQMLIEKYNKLKAAGKLEAFMDKRKKKCASKDHRYMPYRRS